MNSETDTPTEYAGMCWDEIKAATSVTPFWNEPDWSESESDKWAELDMDMLDNRYC